MITAVVRREPDKGYYFTIHNSDGLPVAISRCWPSKDDCSDYVRAIMPARTRIEDDTIEASG